MHFPILALATALLATTTTLAKPLPDQSIAEIERRWSAGETEVCRPNSPGCFLYAWFHSLRTFCRGSDDEDASIHSGRIATPAWPVQREADAEVVSAAFSYAPDERTMLSAQRQKRAENEPLLRKMKAFVNEFYRSRGKKDVLARDAQVVRAEEDSAPVLKPRSGMKYSFTA